MHDAPASVVLLGVLACAWAVPARAAEFKAVLLVRADDSRLERARLERGVLGHPTGPIVDALKVALDEGQLELQSAGASLRLDVVSVADAPSARRPRWQLPMAAPCRC
jgi:hypothetical protein